VPKKRVQGLDVLRGVAVGLVLLRHAWPEAFPGAGIVGVTIFFTLSGYLITEIIRREVERTGSLSFSRFYRSRALRLLPALGALLVIFALVEWILDPSGQRDRILSTVLAGAFYVADVPGLPLASSMGHLWTLAVEEQFYLLWPSVLILGIRRSWVMPLLTACVLLWLVICSTGLVLAPKGAEQVYTLPTTWGITLIIGAAAQLYRDRLPSPSARLAALASAALGAMCFVPDAKTMWTTYLLGGPLVALCTAALILFALRSQQVPTAWTPLRALGLVSYGTYLWNYTIVMWSREWLGDDWLTGLLSIPATLTMAAVSWYAIERPALRWKDRLDHQRPDPCSRDDAVAELGVAPMAGAETSGDRLAPSVGR
jgi:peptidoglycan/LPS O-acetylase OafA/YrhL